MPQRTGGARVRRENTRSGRSRRPAVRRSPRPTRGDHRQLRGPPGTGGGTGPGRDPGRLCPPRPPARPPGHRRALEQPGPPPPGARPPAQGGCRPEPDRALGKVLRSRALEGRRVASWREGCEAVRDPRPTGMRVGFRSDGVSVGGTNPAATRDRPSGQWPQRLGGCTPWFRSELLAGRRPARRTAGLLAQLGAAGCGNGRRCPDGPRPADRGQWRGKAELVIKMT